MRRRLASTESANVPLWKRGAALGVDFLVVGLISAFLSMSAAAQASLFIVGWLFMRVVVVSKNRGQSLGRWAFNMQVVDGQRSKTPELMALTKREGLIALGAALAFLGVMNFGPTAAWALLLFIPLGLDCGVAYANPSLGQAFHDQIAGTYVVQSRLGYSLDIKLKKIVADAQRRVKR